MQMRCDHCSHEVAFYYGCRDRHCPQCQYRASQQWANKQLKSTLPVTYYHHVCTLPHCLNPWVQLHPKVIYQLFFESVWATLNAFGHDPKRLGGQLGVTMMLHTWGQTLIRHVHLHCLIPGGVLTPEGEWKSAKSTYLFPVRAISRHLRGTMVSKLREAFETGKLPRVVNEGEPQCTLDKAMAKEWVVFTKPRIDHTQDVVKYLARYSHRVAISNSRILSIEDNQIQFRYKDYRDNKTKMMGLEADQFIQRYLLHVLPKGVQRIRYCGFMANCCRAAKLSQIRKRIRVQSKDDLALKPVVDSGQDDEVFPCPQCKDGRMWVYAELPRKRLDGG